MKNCHAVYLQDVARFFIFNSSSFIFNYRPSIMINVHSYESMGTFDGPGYGSSFSFKAALSVACTAPTPIP